MRYQILAFLFCFSNSWACPPLPVIESAPQTDDLVAFYTEVSPAALRRLRDRLSGEKSATNYRLFAGALYSSGDVSQSRKMMKEASTKFHSELYAYAKIFLSANAQTKAIEQAAVKGEPRARHDLVDQRDDGMPRTYEIMFWQTQVWKETFDSFYRCTLALKSESSLARQMCINELQATNIKEDKALKNLLCHLNATQN
jgi:hypothetical protein